MTQATHKGGTLKVWFGGKSHIIEFKQGENLLSLLQRNGISVSAPCGGNGTCGKCVVKIRHESCLACKTLTAENMDGLDITVEADGEISIVSAYENLSDPECDRKLNSGNADSAKRNPDPSYGIAIDIGTTTLAFELLDMHTGSPIATHTRANSQRVFGADVVTRITKAVEGDAERLNSCILDDIRQGISELTGQRDAIACVAIAGNTTMLHLLRNLPCDSLGVYPFTPVTVDIHRCSFNELFGEGMLDCEVLILPGISTYVGADIAAGILLCGWPKATGANMLIDLGTNGEMALFTQEKIYVTSTAAGPAFEAGNISRGVGSVPGAIARVNYSPEESVFICETIDNKPPVGICGTGVVDITALLIRHGLVDETGRLEDESDGVAIVRSPKSAKLNTAKPGISEQDAAKSDLTEHDIIFTQKDIREVQLAKSAVRSGIEILLDTAGLKYENIVKVFLAGGFGYKIDIENATTLGIIPSQLESKVLAIGNSSLGGCAHVLLSQAKEAEILNLTSTAEEVSLSTHPRFNMLFMEHMNME